MRKERQMQALKYFGMPVSLNEIDGHLVFNRKEVGCADYQRKYAKDMGTLLCDRRRMSEDEPYYDFYRSLCSIKDEGIFKENGIRFDSTVIMPGKTGKELKKTSGHFHNPIRNEIHSYPELYQVISGTALFIMQKAASHTDIPLVIEDLILAEVQAGETIVVPPDYGHATVNIGKTPMVFVNLIADQCTNYYGSVAESNGMSVFILDDGKTGYKAVKNDKYVCDVLPKIVKPSNSPGLNIIQYEPAYRAFIAQPEKYHYLLDPAEYNGLFFDLFADKNEKQKGCG